MRTSEGVGLNQRRLSAYYDGCILEESESLCGSKELTFLSLIALLSFKDFK